MSTPHTPVPRLDYARADAEPDNADARRVAVIVVSLTCSVIICTTYSYLGIRWGQFKAKQQMLFAPATGTDFYDRMFIYYPTYAFGLLCLVPLVYAAVQVGRRRWRGWWLPVLSIALPVVWGLWVFVMIIFLWEDVSP